MAQPQLTYTTLAMPREEVKGLLIGLLYPYAPNTIQVLQGFMGLELKASTPDINSPSGIW